MDVSKVTSDDGKNCAVVLDLLQLTSRLLDALRLAGLPVTGPGINQKEQAKEWLTRVAHSMAVELKKAGAEPTTMKIGKITPPAKLTTTKQKKKARR